MNFQKSPLGQMLVVGGCLLVNASLNEGVWVAVAKTQEIASSSVENSSNSASEPAPGSVPVLTPAFEPAFEEVDHYMTTIAPDEDLADVYFPVVTDRANSPEFPIALLLQGALVDKADYSSFATQVAKYGFVVVVPNHERQVPSPTGQLVTGFAPEQQQVNTVLAQMVIEDSNPASPIAEIVDTEKLGLLGHSFGGYVGLAAIQNTCLPGVCSEAFTRPPELMAGIFYGTNFKSPPQTGTFVPIDNQEVPTGLIAGSLDQVADLNEAEATYEQIQDAPKVLITVDGANHYSITNQDNPMRDPGRPTLDQTMAIETIARWSALFLRAHLLDDPTALDYVYQSGDAIDPHATVTRESVTRESVTDER